MTLTINILIWGACLLIGIAIGAWFIRQEWIKDLFSESSTASFGRVGAFIALIASVVWVSWLVYKNGTLPDLSGICLFIGTLYGLSKGISAIQVIKGATNDPKPPTS